MSTKQRLFGVAALAALAIGALFAQAPGRRAMALGGPHGARALEFLTDYLSLTSAQQTQAKSIFDAGRSAATPVVTDLKTVRGQMETAVKTNDTKTIDALSVQLGADAGQLAAIRLKGMAQFYAILTPDQQAKASKLHDRMRGMIADRFGL